MKVHNVNCFRRRCRLPLRIGDAYVRDGLVFCSENCFKAWKDENQVEITFRPRQVMVSGVFHTENIIIHSD